MERDNDSDFVFQESAINMVKELKRSIDDGLLKAAEEYAGIAPQTETGKKIITAKEMAEILKDIFTTESSLREILPRPEPYKMKGEGSVSPRRTGILKYWDNEGNLVIDVSQVCI